MKANKPRFRKELSGLFRFGFWAEKAQKASCLTIEKSTPGAVRSRRWVKALDAAVPGNKHIVSAHWGASCPRQGIIPTHSVCSDNLALSSCLHSADIRHYGGSVP